MNLPPELDREVSRLKQRVAALELRLSKAAKPIPPRTATFSLAGILYTSISGPWAHPEGGNLVRLVGLLGASGESATTIRARRNGSSIGGLLTLEEDQIRNETKLEPVRFAALHDLLSIEVVSAGTDAQDLTVLAIFDA